MTAQLPLLRLPRRPSLTAATTRAERAKARAWAKERDLPRWEGTTQTCAMFDPRSLIEGPRVDKHASSGVMMPTGIASHPTRKLCWDCLPYPGAPLRDWETWSTDAEHVDERCVRCLRSTNQPGLIFYTRGGPFCGDCGGGDLNDPVYVAWLLALRDNPQAPSPWYGDRGAA